MKVAIRMFLIICLFFVVMTPFYACLLYTSRCV